MPTLLIWHGYRFRFYSSDGPEPPHIHIVKDGKSAKIWLKSLEVEYAYGYDAKEIAEFSAKVAENRNGWMETWNDYFGI